jgi:SNF2 family DNA or RNA helicase
MPISAQAIERFLERPPRMLPQFKGAPPEKLLRLIYDSTGRQYEAPKIKPYSYQLEGLAFALHQRRSLLYYSMRLGKSRSALEWAEHLRKANFWQGKGLIIAHAPIGLFVWQSEMEKWSGLKAAFVQKSVNEFLDALESDVDLICIPWSGLQVLFSQKRLSRKGVDKLYPDPGLIKPAAKAFSLCIIDEIHLAKDHTSLRFKIAEQLIRHCKFRVGLTGTPVGRDMLAAWAPAYLIDEGKTLGSNYYFFEEAFSRLEKDWWGRIVKFEPSKKNPAKKVEVHYKKVFDKSKLPILQSRLNELAISYELSEVRNVDLRPNLIELRMEGDQAQAYNDAIQRLIKVRDEEPIEILAEFLKLRQIASGFLTFQDGDGNERLIEYPNSAKLAWFKGLLDELGDMPAVIFHEFTHSGEMLLATAKRAGVRAGWLYGGTKDRAGVVSAFQQGKTNLLIANTAVGGMSIDLARADYLAFYEAPLNPTIRAQAEARPLSAARGDRPLLIDDVICAPIERRILKLVQEGKDANKAIMRSPKLLVQK